MKGLPLTKGQQQFWLLDDIFHDTGAYNLSSVFKIQGQLDIEVLRQAIQVVVKRHEALRTCFKLVNDNVNRFVEENLDVKIECINVDDFFLENEENPIIHKEVNSPFSLDSVPLFRFKIFFFKNDIQILSLVFHHIIIDVRSEGVFAQELSIAYQDLLNSNTVKLSPVSFQLSEYTNEILNWYQTEDYQQKLNSFIEVNPNPNKKIELPHDFSIKQNTGKGNGKYFTLNNEIVKKINKLSNSTGLNSYRILLSAYAIFLQRFSNQDEVVIGLPLTNRSRNSSKKTFGCFINALPLQISFDKYSTITSTFEQVKEKLSYNLDNQEVPFTDLVHFSKEKNTSGKNPFFQTGFAFKPPMPLVLEGVTATPLKTTKNGAQLDLFLTFWEQEDELIGFLEYSAELFKDETILRWLDNFKVLLDNLLDNPDQNVNQIDVLSETDIRTWSSFNDTDQKYESELCLHQKFEQQASLTPNNLSIIWGDQSMTYKELNEQANRLAHNLIDQGVQVGDIVAFSLERGPELMAAILAILKAGAAYLPFDTKAPTSRLESIILDAQPKVVLTKEVTSGHLPQGNFKTLYLDDLFDKAIHVNIENPSREISSQNLSYILYTSGSTGKPKGVRIKHHSVMNKIGWMQNKYATNGNDALVLKTPVTFDVSVWELFWWFFNGAKLVLLPPGGEKEPETIISACEKNEATVIIFVPSMFASFVLYLDAMEEARKLSSINLIIQIGEALSPQLVKDFNKLRTDIFNPLMINTYGPTEATVAVSSYDCPNGSDFDKISIGKPIFNTKLLIVNKANKIQPIGIHGELLITGKNLSPGYLNRPELNAEKFIEVEDTKSIKQRAYKTGDLSYLNDSGDLNFIGRIDNQVKVRGYRIELGEIESKMMDYPSISNCAVLVYDPEGTNPQLVGYFTLEESSEKIDNKEIKSFISKKVPDYMVPSILIRMESMPLTTSGKIDRKKLPVPKQSKENKNILPQSNAEEILLDAYKQVLEIDNIDIKANFFELGGSSLLVPIIVIKLKKEHNIIIKTLDFFEYPTIESLANFIESKSALSVGKKSLESETKAYKSNQERSDIAIIGMSGCFPGADNLEEFWQNIQEGKVSISQFSRSELEKKGVNPELLDNPDYIYANGIIDRGDMFDSAFFGIPPKEADFLDPQHRIFLETAYEALENAGYAPTEPRNIGVFAGTGMNSYLFKSLINHPEALSILGEFQTMVNNDKDFISTRTSYKLNLTGPSLDIQTACSTSLVALHMACQSLLTGECEMALSGGAYIHTPRGRGYMFKPGGILSPTGECRPFDQDSNGTILGEGAGVVLLKRLDDAIKDKDNILAVIKATAINNDGANKVGFMAPSIEGQSKVIKKAQEKAGISPVSISYVETHGTGTKIGDPIELTALKKVFGSSTDKNTALGAVKANIGHLDAAAGIAGLIKVVLALNNKTIPPLANFIDYNPDLEIEDSPFFAPKESSKWENKDYPLRAAVSSFGIGGTNAHCIVEEYTALDNTIKESNTYKLLPVSAKSNRSLSLLSEKIENSLKKLTFRSDDIAFTLQKGREVFDYRKVYIGKNTSELVENKAISNLKQFKNPDCIIMFTGQGSQYVDMGKGLYQEFDVFKEQIDFADKVLNEKMGIQLKNILFENGSDINETKNAQPLIVATQLATYKLLESFGIRPKFLIGHSIGELTAACVAGIFSIEDTLLLASKRGELMQKQPKGLMLSINLAQKEIVDILPKNLELALINAPDFCVVSGIDDDIKAFKSELNTKYPDIQATILKTSHAFHSRMMDGAVKAFSKEVSKVQKGKLNIPFISNISGEFIDETKAQTSEYWGNHIRKPVNFVKGITTLAQKESLILEVGPGSMLTSLLSRYNSDTQIKSIPTIRQPKRNQNDVIFFLNAIANYWCLGGQIDWTVNWSPNQRIVPLPTYAFDRRRHWVDTKNYFSFDVISKQIDEEYTSSPHEAENIFDSANDRIGFSAEYIAPKNKLQGEIIKIWEDYLGIKYIGIADNFFELGGHSLLASQVTNKLNKQLGINLPLETLFSYSTIMEFEKLIISESKQNTKETISLSRLESKGYLPVSSEQTRLWTLTQFNNNPAYNIPFTYKLEGNVDPELFRLSLIEVFKRHAMLRGRFTTVDLFPAATIAPEEHVNFNFYDFSDLPENTKEAKLTSFLIEDTQKVFNLADEPLQRIYLIKTSPEEYYFHMTIHHIIFDGWSWGIFVKDFNLAYSSLINNEKVTFTDKPFQYYDYAHWQQNIAKADRFESAISYWKTKLDGFNNVLDFPYDFEREKKNTGLGARNYFRIAQKTSDLLKEFSKKNNTTEFTIYLTAFALLVKKHSAINDFCIGIPSANRGNSDLEGIIGFFVNTLVIRFMMDKEQSFEDFVKNAQTSVLEALEHQELPFDKLVDNIQPERITNVNPFFQFMFSWLNAPRPPIAIPNTTVTRHTVPEGISPLDITVYIWDDNGAIEGEIEYSTSLFTASKIEQLTQDYISILEKISINPEIQIFDILNNTEINSVKPRKPSELSVIDLFVHQALTAPDKTALITSGNATTYGNLHEKSDILASKLISLGAKPGDIIALSLDRDEQMLLTLLSIFKIGASYLPLDPSFPKNRLNYMVQDSETSILITNGSHKNLFDSVNTKLILFEEFDLDKVSSKIPPLDYQPDSMAYMIYTSGSTGLPKGVKISHKSMINFLLSMAEVPGFQPEDTLLAVTTLSFDISVLEIFLPLIKGGRLLLANRSEAVNGKILIELINKHNVSILQATPATWNILLYSGWQGSSRLKALCGGESMPTKLASDLLPKVKELWNMYGPTETTVWSTCKRIESAAPPILVGNPIKNTTIHILDEKNNPVPEGEAGEVCIGGLGVAIGYHNRKDLNMERFITLENKERIYKTGDLGKILKSGEIELSGRIDDQIKLRGFRIEPGEIEALLCQYPGITEAVIKLEKISYLDERLVAFVNSQKNISLEEMQLYLKAKIPDYMVPSDIQVMNFFPRTPNNKIDKKALEYHYNKKESGPDNHIEKSGNSDLERKIMMIWQKFIGKRKISIEDNFFDVGGNSLMLVQLSNEINKEIGQEIDVIYYFDNPTIKLFSNYLKNQIDSTKSNTSLSKNNRFEDLGKRRRKEK